MQQPCRYGSTCKNNKPEDLQTKLNLLLYGHLYVVALLICAFVLMGKKVNKSMQECHVTNPYSKALRPPQRCVQGRWAPLFRRSGGTGPRLSARRRLSRYPRCHLSARLMSAHLRLHAGLQRGAESSSATVDR